MRNFSSNKTRYVLAPGTIFYFLYSRKPHNPFLKPLVDRRHSIHPQHFCEDYSKITILHLKIHIAWHATKLRRYDMDPWDLIVFPAGDCVPFRDEVRLVDIANGVYEKHGDDAALTIVNKERRRGFKAWWSKKGREDRVVPKEVEEVFRGSIPMKIVGDWADLTEEDLEKM